MTQVVYIDVPSDYRYDWNFSASSERCLFKDLGYGVEFVCNYGAQISKGDVYAVLLKDAKDEIFFRLKNKFDIIPTNVAERWIFEHPKRYKSSYRVYFKNKPKFVKYLETKEQEWQQLQA